MQIYSEARIYIVIYDFNDYAFDVRGRKALFARMNVNQSLTVLQMGHIFMNTK